MGDAAPGVAGHREYRQTTMEIEMTSVSSRYADRLHVRVAEIQRLGPNVRAFTLVSREGGHLPAFVAGSYVVVNVAMTDEIKFRPYSLTSCPENLDHYQIMVGKGASTSGVSGFLHERVEVGAVLEISRPMNGMELAPEAAKHVLIAGGMGVTPFFSHLSVLASCGAAYELHYSYPTAEEGVFLYRLSELPAGTLFTYTSREGNRLDTDRLLAAQPDGTHFYVSGSRSLVEGVIASAWRLGLSAGHIHFERSMEIDPSLSVYLERQREVALAEC